MTTKTTDKAEVARVLRDTADYLDRYGWLRERWVQSRYDAIEPEACLYAAIRIAVLGNPTGILPPRVGARYATAQQFALLDSTVDAVTRYLTGRLGFVSAFHGAAVLVEWNDRPGRTVTEVLAVLYAVAGSVTRTEPAS